MNRRTYYDVRGKTVLVTGAARGIGLETARRLHGRGANVVLVGLEPEQLEQRAAELGDRATYVRSETYRGGLAGVALIRHVIGWRDYRWPLYWLFGANRVLHHRRPVRFSRASRPTHHRPRLPGLGDSALQHSWDPTELTSWFDRSCFEAYDGLPMPNGADWSRAYLRLRSS